MVIRSQQTNFRLAFCIVAGVVLLILSHQSRAEQLPEGSNYVNSIGMKLVRIEPGSFSMGCQNPDGIIHIISGKQYYAFNLKWLKNPARSEEN